MSHHELILQSELDLKILKTHLGVILFLINLIISIYCLLSPETETFMLFLGAQGLKLLQIFIVTISEILDSLFELSSNKFNRFSLRNETFEICAFIRPGT